MILGANSIHLGCPRCGYDQAGAVAAWERLEPARCPLDGLCTECGQGFAWADVFRAALRDLPWLYEHAPRWSTGFGRAWRTWARVIPAGRFWRAVGVRQRTSIARLLVWLLIVLGPLHLAAAVLVARGMPWLPLWWKAGDGLLAPFAELGTVRGGRVVVEWHVERLPAFVVITPVVATLWPVMMLILGTSRSRAALRPGYLMRAWVYSLWWLAPVAGVRLIELAWASFVGGRPWVVLWNVVSYGDPPLLVATFAWTAWWWKCAIREGWKLERAGTIWALLGVASLLVAVILAALNMGVVWWLFRNRIIQ